MSFLAKSIRVVYMSTLLRKIVHLVFSLLLLVPFTQTYRGFFIGLLSEGVDPTLITLTILLFSVAIINSIQIRIPNLRERFLRSSTDVRRKIAEGIEAIAKGKLYAEAVEGFMKFLTRYEEKFLEFISIIERDYELRYGYICITFALLSITMSYVLFDFRVIYGILALAVVDSVSSIITTFTSWKTHKRLRLKHSYISIAITFSIFTFILYTISRDLPKSVVVSVIAIITELLSPEDNLTLPIATSFIAHALEMPIPII